MGGAYPEARCGDGVTKPGGLWNAMRSGRLAPALTTPHPAVPPPCQSRHTAAAEITTPPPHRVRISQHRRRCAGENSIAKVTHRSPEVRVVTGIQSPLPWEAVMFHDPTDPRHLTPEQCLDS